MSILGDVCSVSFNGLDVRVCKACMSLTGWALCTGPAGMLSSGATEMPTS